MSEETSKKLQMSLDEISSMEHKNHNDNRRGSYRGKTRGNGRNYNDRDGYVPKRRFNDHYSNNSYQPRERGGYRGRFRGTRGGHYSHYQDDNYSNNYSRRGKYYHNHYNHYKSYNDNNDQENRTYQPSRFNHYPRNKYNNYHSNRRDSYNNYNNERDYHNERGYNNQYRRKYDNEDEKKQVDTRKRLYVSNLHYSVVNTELRKIFESVGPLKRCGIRWDDMGNSSGTADVEYDSPVDASKAVMNFNNAEIEGIIMKVEYSKDNMKYHNNEGTKRRVFRKTLGFKKRNYDDKA